MMTISADKLEKIDVAVKLTVEHEIEDIKTRLVKEYRRELDALLVRVVSKVIPATMDHLGVQGLEVAIVLQEDAEKESYR